MDFLKWQGLQNVSAKRLILLLLSFCLSQSGCVKKPQDKEDDGPEAQPEEISEASLYGLGDLDFSKTKKGDFVFFESEQMVRGSDVITPLRSSAMTVRERLEDDQWIIFGLTQENIKYKSDGTNERFVKDFDNCGVIKNQTTSFLKNLDPEISFLSIGLKPSRYFINSKTSLQPSSFNLRCMTSGDESPPTDSPEGPTDNPTTVSYHNLKVERKQMDPPDLVKQSSDCGGLAPCFLNVTEVTFDVFIKTRDSKERISVRRVFSQDVPLVPLFNPATSKELSTVSRIIESCQQMSVPGKDKNGNELRVLVSQCDRLKNFRFGTN